MNTENPLVSVIIPTYKRAALLRRAIDSVLGQTYEEIEIIVVDDNNDGDEYRVETQHIMDSYYSTYNNIKYIKHHKNMNGSAARNTGFKHSSGAFIMFLDDDDMFFPDKVYAQVNCMLSRDNSWGACYTAYVRKKGERVVMRSAEKREGNLIAEELARNLFVHAGSNLMIRRNIFEELGGFDESFQRNQDIELLVRILEKYKLAYVDVLGLAVNVHPASNNINFIILTEQYKEKFSHQIDALGMEAKSKVLKMLSLQIFRYYLLHKDIRNALAEIKKNQIRIIEAILYLCHLLRRRIFRVSCGFNMSFIK